MAGRGSAGAVNASLGTDALGIRRVLALRVAAPLAPAWARADRGRGPHAAAAAPTRRADPRRDSFDGRAWRGRDIFSVRPRALALYRGHLGTARRRRAWLALASDWRHPRRYTDLRPGRLPL